MTTHQEVLPHEFLRFQVRIPTMDVFILDDPKRGVLDISRLGGDFDEEYLFVLDKSRLDEQLLTGPGDDPNSIWTDLLAYVQSVKLHRGLEETEVGAELEAGILNVTLRGPELDPHQNLSIQVGADVRLITIEDEPVFTGTVRRVVTNYDKDGRVRVNLTIQDVVQKAANIMQYGVVEEEFPARIDSLLGKHAIPHQLLPGVPNEDGDILYTDLAATDYDSNLLNHLNLAVATEQGHMFADRSGTLVIGPKGTKYDPYNRSVNRINLAHNGGFRINEGLYVSLGAGTFSHVMYGGRQGTGAIKKSYTATTAVAGNGFAVGTFQASKYAIKPNTTYTLSAYFKSNLIGQKFGFGIEIQLNEAASFAIQPMINTSAVATTALSNEWVRGSYTFTTPANAYLAKVEFKGVSGSVATNWVNGDYMMMADLLLEDSDIDLEFFDGLTPDAPPVYHIWDDERSPYGTAYQIEATVKPEVLKFYGKKMDDPTVYYYNDIQYEYDSANIVNELKVDNRTATGTVTTTYRDETSINAYGASSATLELNHRYSWGPDLIGERALALHAYPVNTVKSLTFNATGDMEMATSLDPYQVIQVQFENNYFEEIDVYTILNVEHEIVRDKWMTTLTLAKFNVKEEYK